MRHDCRKMFSLIKITIIVIVIIVMIAVIDSEQYLQCEHIEEQFF
jgi:hypothetical protein